jgi:hypothetical protein
VDGQRRLIKVWYAGVQYDGKRQFFSLATPNKAVVSANARVIYLALVTPSSKSTFCHNSTALNNHDSLLLDLRQTALVESEVRG